MKHTIFITAFVFFFLNAFAQQTEIQYLSGTGLNSEKIWKFRCSEGANSGKWSKIKVPSQWEVQGFGEYTYGRWYTKGLKNPSMEFGEYEYDFTVPRAWNGKSINIVFEGVMTDAEVKNQWRVGRRNSSRRILRIQLRYYRQTENWLKKQT